VPTLVQLKIADYASLSNGSTIAFDSNITSGNTIVVLGLHSYAGCPPSLSDGLGNTYSPKGTRPSLNTEIVEIFTAPITVGGACTVTTAMSCGLFRNFAMAEVSGLKADPFDQQNGTYNASASSPFAAGSITPAEAGEYIFALFSSGGSGRDLSDGGGAGLTERGNNTNNDCTILDKTHTSGAINPDVSFAGGALLMRGVVASFKATPSAPSKFAPPNKLRPRIFAPGLAR